MSTATHAAGAAAPNGGRGPAALVAKGYEHWLRFWYAPIDAAPLMAFRQAFAWSMLIYFAAWSLNAEEWLTDAGYHPPIELDSVNGPRIPLMPRAALPIVGVVFFGSLLAYIFGFARRVTVWVILAGAIYALSVDPISAFTINRLFVIGWTILAIAPEPEQAQARPDAAAERASDGVGDASIPSGDGILMQVAWPTRMLQVTLLAQYFGAGMCKAVNGDWWGGTDVLFLQVQGFYMTDAAAWMIRNFPHWTWTVQQELALWFELLAPVLLVLRRLRPVGFVLGIGLHLVVALTMHMLIYFSLQMITFYLLFLPPDWARKLAPSR